MKHITSYFIPELISEYTDIFDHTSAREYIEDWLFKSNPSHLNVDRLELYEEKYGKKTVSCLKAFYEDKIYSKVEVMSIDIACGNTIGFTQKWDIMMVDPNTRSKLFFVRWKELETLPLSSEFIFDVDMDEFYPHWYVAQGDDEKIVEISTFEEFRVRFNKSVEIPEDQYLTQKPDYFKTHFSEKNKAALNRHFDNWGSRVNFIWTEFWECDDDHHYYGEGSVYEQNCFKGGPSRTPILAIVK